MNFLKALLALAVVVLYQNCSGGFRAGMAIELDSTSEAPPATAPPDPPPPATGNQAFTETVTQMSPGTWAIVAPTNPRLIENMHNVFADSMAWDPTSKKILFIGSYHDTPYQFLLYDTETNTYSLGPDLPGLPASTHFVGHAYDGNTINPATGDYYYHIPRDHIYHIAQADGLIAHDLYKFNIASNTWTILPDNSLKTTYTCCDAFAYFPEMGGVVWFDATGELFLLKDGAGSWSHVGAVAGFKGGTFHFAEYNPALKFLLVGGGNENALYKLSASGQITPLGNSPYPFQDGSGFTANISVDPVSGEFVILPARGITSPFQASSYLYNSMTNTWSATPHQPPDGVYGALTTTPVSTYGVTATLVCDQWTSNCDGRIAVYMNK
jgi:hypothetical protein